MKNRHRKDSFNKKIKDSCKKFILLKNGPNSTIYITTFK